MAITITPDDLKKSAVKYRKQLLLMMTIGLEASLKHMTPRLGVQYKETIGEYSGNAQLGPYDPDRTNTTTTIKGRTLEVFLGSVIKKFDPNDVWQSIYGSLVLHGEGLKNVDITKAVLAAEIKSISEKMNAALFSASRVNSGTTSAELFNGFDTITTTEITGTDISATKKNLYEFASAISNVNAVDLLKTYFRAASDELQSVPTKMFISKDIYNAYVDDYQQTVGSVPYNKEFKKTYLEGSDDLCELVALSNKKNSPYIQLTTKNNMIVGMGAGNSLEKLDVDRFEAFQVTLSMAAVFGVQYETISPERLLVGKLYVSQSA
ncbi:MAG: hypothetical protein LBP72_01780 [Dysgonamonadaceae bacterium]|jgi:hypothetical protein|nr:hypothetical protein [Dysgonamonadaceae bacterium]